MTHINFKKEYVERYPVRTGLFGVLAVLVLGIGMAFATGLITPDMVKAQVVCCGVVPPPAPPPPPPPPPPPVPPPPVVPIVPPLPPPSDPDPVVPAIPPLSAICTGSPSTVSIGETVTWNVIASGSNGIYTYSWSGTDGLSSTDPSLGWEYMSAGTKTANVTVTTSTETVSVSCDVEVTSVVVPPIPEAPICVLTASPSAIGVGGSTTLTWTTQNTNSFVLDNGLGFGAFAGGSMTVSPTVTTTYTGTASGDGGTATCSTTVTVTSTPPPPPGPICVLTASPSSIAPGESTVLSWTSENATFAFIDNGIDNVSPVSAGSVTVSPTADTTYILTVGGGLSGLEAACSASVSITSGGGGTSSGGGGGGGSRRSSVTLDLLKLPSEAPFASVYLSQIPYTGLTLTGAGMILYWLGLIGLIGLVSYFILFKVFPGIHSFSERVVTAVRDTPTAPPAPVRVEPIAPVMQAAAAVLPAPEMVVPAASSPAREDESAYSPFHGFRSFGSSEKITIDDIVKGLSRLPVVDFVDTAVDTVTDSIASAAATGTEMVKDGYRALVHALMKRDREGAFAALRAAVADGETPERVMTQAVCAIDDVYRNRIDGAACDPELQNVCAPCDTKELEHMVSSLTTAVDASYSTGVTGAKLALVRALDSAK